MSHSAFHRNLLAWYASHGRILPWRDTNAPYAITVSEFMLQQTQVVTVLPYYERWMRDFPTLGSLAAASLDDVLSHWQGLGYYSRARNLHRLAQTLCQEYDGVFPQTYEELRRLPGVGEYTACAILAFAFDLPAPVVDGNIARVLTRWFDCTTPIDTAVGRTWLQKTATSLQPSPGKFSAAHWNSAVMELGATLCRAGHPDCLLCPVRRQCRTRQAPSLPRKAPRRPVTELEETRALYQEGNRIFLEQSQGPRWRGLWRLPEITPEPGEPIAASLTYPITRYRIRLHLAIRPAKLHPPHLEAFPLSSLPALPAPDRRILKEIGLLP